MRGKGNCGLQLQIALLLSYLLFLSLSFSISFGLTFKAAYIRSEMSSVPLIDLISFRVSALSTESERAGETERGKKKKSRRILESLADINYGPIIPRSRKSGSRLANGEHLAHEGSPLTSIAKKLINRKRCQERQRENEGEGESSRILIELYRVLKERRCETEKYILPAKSLEGEGDARRRIPLCTSSVLNFNF